MQKKMITHTVDITVKTSTAISIIQNHLVDNFPDGYDWITGVETFENERAKAVDYKLSLRNHTGEVQKLVTKQHFLTSNSVGYSDRRKPLSESGKSTMDILIESPSTTAEIEFIVTMVFTLEKDPEKR